MESYNTYGNRGFQVIGNITTMKLLRRYIMKKLTFLAFFTLLAVTAFAQNISDFDIQGNDDGTMTILNYKGSA